MEENKEQLDISGQISLLVGKRVRYSISKQNMGTGVIMDKVYKKEKVDDICPITAYMIEDDVTEELIPVAFWRVLKVLKENDDKEKKQKGYLRGGYKPPI